MDSSQGHEQLNHLNHLLSAAQASSDANDELLLFSDKLSSEEQQIVNSILYEKRAQLENKRHMTFFKNYLSLSENHSPTTVPQYARL